MELKSHHNVYITMCDILGFKDIITENTFETAQEIMQSFVGACEFAAAHGQTALYEIDGKIVHIVDRDNIKVSMNLFSDTVVLWTHDNSVASFFDLLRATQLLFNRCLTIGLPIRGAISSGNLYASSFEMNAPDISPAHSITENVMFGKALINAYKLEKKQEWSGCIIDPELRNSSEFAIRHIFEASLQGEPYLIYNVPIKNQVQTERHLVLNWINWRKPSEFTEESIREAFSKHNKSVTAPSVPEKIQNTVDFFHESIRMYTQRIARNK